MRRLFVATIVFSTVAFLIPSLFGGTVASAAVVPVNRNVEAVVMTGKQIPSWSRLSADGAGNQSIATDDRDAHHGTLAIPPDARAGVPVNQVTAFKWNGTDWKEVPVQVDQQFPYFLVNDKSSFGTYSQVDEELTYEWDIESWKKIAGDCTARYPDPLIPTDPQDPSRLTGYPTHDPLAALDNDDQISFYASDSGPQAPTDARAPQGTVLTDAQQPGFKPRQEIALVDPVNGTTSYVYLFLTTQGPSFNANNGYVQYQRDANADQWIDRYSFAADDPEILGTSNTVYGPNLSGSVCYPTQHSSTDRFPRDGMTVSTRRYQLHASGRWMVRTTRVAKVGTSDANPEYGIDLVDRWKGRAFQQSPDSSISVVGFEDEQVNWEANSALLGERFGPVRAIREIWGADSGTNVTKTEYFYRDFYLFRYHLRVHPIPPDGLYTSWDHNAGAVTRYFNEGMSKKNQNPEGVPIDGQNDDVGQIDKVPITGQNAFFDATDPTFGLPLAIFNWEEVSGSNGSLVYMFELNDVRAGLNPAVIPYYRDDSCFDDGTGDDPSPRVRPGEATSDTSAEYRARPCWGTDPDPQNPPSYSMTGPWRQGCIACHGVHFLITHDTDNAFLQKPSTEVDGQQFIWAAPTNAPANVGEEYANTAKFALEPAVTPQDSRAPKDKTDISNTGATSGRIGEQVTLSAHLVKQGDGGLANKPVQFSLDGQALGTANTNASGDAQLQVTLQGPARQTKLTESFAGDADYVPSSTTVDFEVQTRPTGISNTGPTSGRIADKVTLSARLTDAGAPLAGENVAFSFDGNPLGAAATDSNGVARLQVTLAGPARTADLTESFGGDAEHAPSSATVQFQIQLRPTALALSVTNLDDQIYRARATLKDSATGAPLAGKTVAFSKNGNVVGSATTNSTGRATVTIKRVRKGNVVAVNFAGDDTYAASRAQKKV